MTYSLLAEAFFLPTFTLSKENKQTRRLDGVQSSHLYLCKSLTQESGNKSSHHFSLIVVFDVTFTLDHSGASFIIFSLLGNDLWAGTWIPGQNELILLFNSQALACYFFCSVIPKTSRLGVIAIAHVDCKFLWTEYFCFNVSKAKAKWIFKCESKW